MPQPERFRLAWEIDIDADRAATPEEAAKEARKDFMGGCQVFDVTEEGEKPVRVDLVPDHAGLGPLGIDPLAEAAREVVRRWAKGDLAQAVRRLAHELEQAGIEV